MTDTKQDRTSEPKQDEKLPAAGPHAKPELTDYEKTPGTGSLPDETDSEADIGPG